MYERAGFSVSLPTFNVTEFLFERLWQVCSDMLHHPAHSNDCSAVSGIALPPKTCSDVATDDPTRAQLESMKRAPIIGLFVGRLRQVAKPVGNGWSEGKEKRLWIWLWLRGGARVRIPRCGQVFTFPEGPKRETVQTSFSACPDAGRERKGIGATWKLLAFNHQKWIQILYYKLLLNLFRRSVGHFCVGLVPGFLVFSIDLRASASTNATLSWQL